jgi:hypothetical protein
MQRFASGERHPGHMDHLREAYLNTSLIHPLALGGHVIELDTTSFEAIDYEALFAQIRRILVKAAPTTGETD